MSGDQVIEEDYGVIKLVGEGSYGAVYSATYRPTMEIVAIKKAPLDANLERTLGEVDILKRTRHQNIVKFHGTCQTQDSIWIVMEFCEAGSLLDIMKALGRPLLEVEIGLILDGVIAGLNYLHENKRLHRDLKCGNILMSYQGVPKIADFGVSVQLARTMEKRFTVIGTPYWMAPEVIHDIGYDHKADIWSLGISIIEMTQLKPPHSDLPPMRALFAIPFQPAPRLQSGGKWSIEMQDFVSRCLIKEPKGRFSTTELMKHPFMKITRNRQYLADLIDQYKASPKFFIENEPTQFMDSFSPITSSKIGEMPQSSSISIFEDSMTHPEQYGTIKELDQLTMVHFSDATFIENDQAEETIPQFKKYMDEKAPGTKVAWGTSQPPLGSEKYSGLSLTELRDILNAINAQESREIEAIREKYAKQKELLRDMISRRESDL